MTLEQLKHTWLLAKTEEQRARELRLSIEDEILKLINPVDEGTVRATPDLRITFELNRSVDTEDLQRVWSTLDAEQQKAFRWKASVSVTALRNIPPERLEPLSKLIKVKPAKPSFSVRE